MPQSWAERLDRHFSALRAEREIVGLPVFALEHGLDASEVSDLTSYLHSQLKNNARLSPDWLAWVVYGAELGYDYDGQEYWASFEDRTPLWTWRANRRQLRDWFTKFHRTYRGFRPQGNWAEWFSIISWPITHAILPKDLQTQLAGSLYQLRFGIAARIDDEPASIGHYIAGRGEGSSRFRNFLQQEELVGRIAVALLGGEQVSSQGAIVHTTLERIVRDLEKRQSAKAWLGDARREVERARIHGFGGYGLVSAKPKFSTALDREWRPFLQPSISLQRVTSSDWVAIAQFPSFRPLVDLSGEIGRFLRTTRCTVSGTDGFLPAGWLLSDGQRRVLTAWPDPSLPLVRFEKTNHTLDKLLQSDARMTGGPLWLFEIAIDGKAREVKSHRIQAGRRYLVISPLERANLPFSLEATVRCEGCFAKEMTVPARLSDEDFRELRAAGLHVRRTVSIWPAGLPARRWDGESRAEWLEGEVPSFGIEADHDVKRLTVSVDDAPPLTFYAIPAGQKIFLSLPNLLQGNHLLRVVAEVADTKGDAASSNAVIELAIRPPTAWTAGATDFKGLVATIEPPDPSLDDFWEGRASLNILGPARYNVKIYVELLDAGNNELSTEEVGELTLPMNTEAWARLSSQFIKNWAMPWAYLSASSGNLIVSNDELGTYRIPLHRDVRPVRLIWHGNGKTMHVRLIDDHQGEQVISASFYPFTAPCRETPISLADLETGFEPPAPGGLFVLQHGEAVETLAVSMPQVGALTELVPEPAADGYPFGKNAPQATRALITLWLTMSLAGPLAGIRRERVIRRLEQHFYRLLCGTEWWEAEKEYERSNKHQDDLKAFARRTCTSQSFAVLISRDLQLLQALDEKARTDRFAELAVRYGISDIETSRAAMSVCSKSDKKVTIDEASLAHLVNLGKAARPIIRAARFLTEAVIVNQADNASGGAP